MSKTTRVIKNKSKMQNTSKYIDEIAKALSAFQSEVKTIDRNKEVSVKTKTGGTYKFKYAPLESIIESVKETLHKNGLSVNQAINCDGEYLTVRTTLLHISGQYMYSDYRKRASASMQEDGSLITYIRRYTLQSILGISTEEDDDANLSVGNSATILKPSLIHLTEEDFDRLTGLDISEVIKHAKSGKYAFTESQKAKLIEMKAL